MDEVCLKNLIKKEVYIINGYGIQKISNKQ